jgi:hypothetical protein
MIKMERIVKLLIVVFVLLSIISCSSNKSTSESPAKNPVTPTDNTQIVNSLNPNQWEGPFVRNAADYSDTPAFSFSMSPEFNAIGSVATGAETTRLIEDIGAICDQHPNPDVNYVLAVDLKLMLRENSNVNFYVDRARIFKVPVDADDILDVTCAKHWGNYSTYLTYDNSIASPQGCELVDSPERNVIYSLIADAPVGVRLVKMFKNTVDANGVLGETTYVNKFQEDGEMTIVRGVSCVMFADANDAYDSLVFICDPGNSCVRVFTQINSTTARIADLVCGEERPMDVTAVKANNSTVFVYASVMDLNDRADDYVQCFMGTKSGGTWTWSAGTPLVNSSSSQPELKFLTNIAVHEFNAYPDNQLTMLTYDDSDGVGIRIFQVTLGYGGNYYQYDDSFTYLPTASAIFTDGLGVGYADFDGGGSGEGFFYFVGDKDPNLINVGGSSDGGDNISVYENAS